MTSKPTVQLSLFQRPNNSLYWEVRVRCTLRPVARLGFLEQYKATEQTVGVLAGALAEELCERYHDTLDPSECDRIAREAYREIIADLPKPKPGDELPRDADRAVRVANYH